VVFISAAFGVGEDWFSTSTDVLVGTPCQSPARSRWM